MQVQITVPLLPFYLKCACVMCLFLEDSSSSFSLVLAVPPHKFFLCQGEGAATCRVFLGPLCIP